MTVVHIISQNSCYFNFNKETKIKILENADLIIPETDVVLSVIRTGKAVTLINLSLTEPETVFRVFNEIFYLISIPTLDTFFRTLETGKLKEIFGFIVDNGASEAPSSLLVQMLLVRLLTE